MWYQDLLIHDITVWIPGGRDRYGNRDWEREVIKGRWEGRAETVTNTDGDQIVSSSIVFLEKEVPKSCYLYKGVSDADKPEDESEARPIEQLFITDSIDGLQTEFRAVLT